MTNTSFDLDRWQDKQNNLISAAVAMLKEIEVAEDYHRQQLEYLSRERYKLEPLIPQDSKAFLEYTPLATVAEAEATQEVLVESPEPESEPNPEPVDDESAEEELELVESILSLLHQVTAAKSDYLAQKLKLDLNYLESILNKYKLSKWYYSGVSETWYVVESKFPKKFYNEIKHNGKPYTESEIKRFQNFKLHIPPSHKINECFSLTKLIESILESAYPNPLTTQEVFDIIYEEVDYSKWSRDEHNKAWRTISARLSDGHSKKVYNWARIKQGVYKYTPLVSNLDLN